MRLATTQIDMDDVEMMVEYHGTEKNLGRAALRKAMSENVDGSRCELHRRNRRETLRFSSQKTDATRETNARRQHQVVVRRPNVVPDVHFSVIMPNLSTVT